MRAKFKDLPINASFFTDALPDPEYSIEYVKVDEKSAVVAPWSTPRNDIKNLTGVKLPFHDTESVINAEFVPF